MDRRDEYIRNAKNELEANGDKIRGKAVFEAREDDYSQFNNTYSTYRIPSSNPYMEKLQASQAK